MKLAAKLGINHEDFLATTSAKEVGEYKALNLFWPLFAEDRIDTAAATLANLVHNLGRHPDTKSTTMFDWLPDYEARFRPPVDPDEEIMRVMNTFTNQVNSLQH